MKYINLWFQEDTGSIIDVYIDTLGFITGVCLMLICIKLIQIHKNKKIMYKEKGN